MVRPHLPASQLLRLPGKQVLWETNMICLLSSDTPSFKQDTPHKLAWYSKPNVFSSTPVTKGRNLEYTLPPHDIKSLYNEDSLGALLPHLVWWTKENTTLDKNTNKQKPLTKTAIRKNENKTTC